MLPESQPHFLFSQSIALTTGKVVIFIQSKVSSFGRHRFTSQRAFHDTHEGPLMLPPVVWSNRGQQQVARGPSLAHHLEQPPFFYIKSQRSFDSSCTWGIDPAGRGTCFTEAITPSAVSESSSSPVTITYITEQPVVLWKHPWPSRWELVSLTKFEPCRCMFSIHGRALWY